MYKVTVVVPVYNVEKYLIRCIESLINQTLKEIEIILVNDGSKDKSGKICEKYALKYKNIKVIHQLNKGLSGARNTGIKIAQGEYVGFVDSDDYVEKDMFELLYTQAKRNECEISCCGTKIIYENGVEKIITKQSGEKIFSTKEALDNYFFSDSIDVISGNKIYKKELFNKILFPEGKIYEDMATIYKYIKNSNKIYFNSLAKYNYCKRENSISNNNFNEKTLDLIKYCDEICDYIEKRYPNLENYKVGQIQWHIVVANKMIIANKIDKNFISKVKEKIKKNINLVLKSEHLSIKRKIQIILFLVDFNLYVLIYKNINRSI